MKKIALIFAIALGGILYNTADAQIRFHVGIRFGARPVYVPSRVVVAQPSPVAYTEPADYDGDDDFYYLPDADAYYSVPERCYYYNDGGAWVSSAYLPGAYRNFDWRNARRFEVRAPRPYLHNDYYRAKFNGRDFNGRWNERSYDHRGYVNSYHEDYGRHGDYNDRSRYGDHDYGKHDRGGYGHDGR